MSDRRGVQPRHAFRPDIEGLRAVCIVAVVFYHARLPGFPGGYVGVDAFFVISGFLITGILVREFQRANRIDLLNFWSRRAARLLPNATLTLLVTLAGVMTLSQVLDRATELRDIAAALLYFVNFRFAARSLDYFDQGVQSSPVLHFWSLSIEEQFYAAWPIILMSGALVFRRFHKNAMLIVLGVLAAASFSMMAYWGVKAPPRAFFDTESRVWQLAVGAILAVSITGPPARERFAAAISWLGLLGLVLSIVLLDDSSARPGLLSLLPTVSTAAAIYGGASSRYATLFVLRSPILQWIGGRSYSIYLWHWPLFVFAAAALGGPTVTGTAIALALLLPVAGLAYAWVERPIRLAAPRHLSSRRILGVAAASCFGVAALALALPHFDPAYASARATMLKRLEEARNDGPRMAGGTCDVKTDSEVDNCVFGKRGAARKVVLFGDSHAEHLFDGLEAAATATGWELHVWVRERCPPILLPGADDVCAKWLDRAVAWMAAEKPELVVVSSWTGAASRLQDPASGKRYEAGKSLEIWKAGFARMLAKLGGLDLPVAVIRDTPASARSLGTECLETRAPGDCVTARAEAVDQTAPDVEVARAAQGVELLDLTDRFCDAKGCPAVRDGMVVYRADNNHLTATMSLTLESDFARLLDARR